jgi:phage gpG-like protein
MAAECVAGVAGAVAKMDGAAQGIYAEVRAEVATQTMSVLELAKRKVSGQVLRNVSSTLMRKLNARIDEVPGRIVGTVGIKLTYAAAHEFGFKGAVRVRAHQRRVNLREVLQEAKSAKGRTIKRKVQVHDRLAQVKEHTRQMLMPQRSYLRTALAERKEAIVAAIQAAAERGAAK